MRTQRVLLANHTVVSHQDSTSSGIHVKSYDVVLR
jgi:hypothetical protein